MEKMIGEIKEKQGKECHCMVYMFREKEGGTVRGYEPMSTDILMKVVLGTVRIFV